MRCDVNGRCAPGIRGQRTSGFGRLLPDADSTDVRRRIADPLVPVANDSFTGAYPLLFPPARDDEP